ncbi:MAG: porin [Gemmatimonadota bacterium]|nr:porin [Gemmatimonadota bacterium]
MIRIFRAWVVAILVPLLTFGKQAIAQSTGTTAQHSAPDSTKDATPDTSEKTSFGAFVDGYYAYDFDRPANFDRSYTTQPARHNEFNINLAFVEARVDGSRIHGRLALQAGTSVQANYAGEPTNGIVSGPSLSRFIQEAFAGYKVANNLWIDGGIFFSHIGNESFISRDNWNYSRSLVAEYTPYYESGVRAVWQATPKLTSTFAVVNGWQNISETNADKAVGVRLDYAANSRVTLSYDNLVGNEQPDSLPSRLRIFNELIAKVQVSDALGLAATYDYGVQKRGSGAGDDSWHGAALIGRYQVTPTVAVNGRVEYFGDPGQVLITVPAAAASFRSAGASIGIDVSPQARLMWRTELRGFSGPDPMFPDPTTSPSSLSRRDGFVVTSVGMTF